MSSPKVSVVMSVFNGQEFLPDAVKSVLAQTFRDFEFLIIDDGSTDGTPEILNSFEKQDKRVRIIRHANKGRAESLNVGIGLTNGEYIARMDADDIAFPYRLEEQIVFMEKHPGVGLLSGAYERVASDGRILDTVRPPLRDDEIRLMMLRTSAMCHPAVMMKRDIVMLSGGYRKALLDADDYDLWLRMSERTQLANLPQTILRYRVHSKQASISNSGSQSMCVVAARTAASFRNLGKPDPLADIDVITPQFLLGLGVPMTEIHDALVANYLNWLELLKKTDSQAALRLIQEFITIASSTNVNRVELANAWLAAARIHYKQKKLGRALGFAGRALLFRPSVVGHAFCHVIDPIRGAFRVRFWHPLLNFTRPIRHTLGLRQKMNVHHKDLADTHVYKDWADREFAAPSPHFVKQKVLLRNGLPDATWVETGTYMGDTTTVLSKVAKMVYSIEPEPTLFSKAEEKFRNASNVKIIRGLSEDVFPKLLPTIGGDVCFWLDGHYSAGITFKGPQHTPIIDELAAIGRNIEQMGKIVVMVDDVRCFDPGNPEYSAYPPVDVLVDWARKHNLTWHIEHDIFIAKNQ
jgi:glycosyltransferase involved in cell wall biosynthesis